MRILPSREIAARGGGGSGAHVHTKTKGHDRRGRLASGVSVTYAWWFKPAVYVAGYSAAITLWLGMSDESNDRFIEWCTLRIVEYGVTFR